MSDRALLIGGSVLIVLGWGCVGTTVLNLAALAWMNPDMTGRRLLIEHWREYLRSMTAVLLGLGAVVSGDFLKKAARLRPKG